MNYPYVRLRRNSKAEWSRDLISTTRIAPSDLIYPIFVHDHAENIAIKSLPGQFRLSIQGAINIAKQAADLGIPALALFPVVNEQYKCKDGREALNKNNLIARAVTAIKREVPDIGLIVDVALDPYTTHGHDGLVDESGYVINDQTVEVLTAMALQLAGAGVDAVAPSDMMDGRVKAIREALEAEKFHNVQIISYSAKFASNFYGSFRSAVGAASLTGAKDKKTYQLDIRSSRVAMLEIEQDINEGADMVIVKPGLPYLDIIRMAADRFNVPILGYQVSGEYSMLKLSAQQGVMNYEQGLLETMISFKRAGCSAVFTYAALELASML